MCGIIGYLGKCDCFNHLLNGLKQLQNRGYDSAGICTVQNKDGVNRLVVSKCASTETKTAIEMLSKCSEVHNASVGIGHTRWATHGPKTDVNAHPHLDMTNTFSVVHNGIIENYEQLKTMLCKNGYTFRSETDTEVIVNLVSFEYKRLKGESKQDSKESSLTKNAIMAAINQLRGTYAIALLNANEPNVLYCVRYGSPLLIGTTDNMAIVTSEKSAFEQKLTNYLVIDNNNLCILSMDEDGKVVLNCENPKSHKNMELAKEDVNVLGEYKFWTEKEINEQVESSMRALANGGRITEDLQIRLGGLERSHNSLKRLSKIRHIVLVGCGTSYHAGLLGSHYFLEFCKFKSVKVVDGAELKDYHFPKGNKTACIFLSQSGETEDVARCIAIATRNNVYKIGVVNVVDSRIAREVDCGVYLNAGREVAVASTKSFTSQVIVLMLMSLWFSQIPKLNKPNSKIQIVKDLRNISSSIAKTIKISETACHYILPFFENWNSCFLLGKGPAEAIAREGALKIKEVSYIHAEGCSASSLKHGPFALLQKDFPVIIIALNDENFQKCLNAIIEIKSRGAKVIMITNVDPATFAETSKKVDYIIQLPIESKWVGEVLSIIPIQVLAYRLALVKKLNPDLPRNLAKVVTVE